MAFPEEWLDELMKKNDIVSVISSYVDLKPKGKRLWGLCPLHGEKTPSFSVSPEKQMFYCFGCHAGGTVIQFLMKMEHLTYLETIQKMAERANMVLPELDKDSEYLKEKRYRDRLYEACKSAARYYMETLLGEQGKPGKQYLAKRNINRDSVKRFGLGFAPEGWDNLKKHLNNQGFNDAELLDAGLLVKSQKNGHVYDAYRNRVIFPIINASQNVIGFGARVMDGSKPKYINTGDTPIYNKRYNLYGINAFKGQILNSIIIVEGYTDVIGLYEAGVDNAVASLGTALTFQQAKLLKRYTNVVYIAYDGDSAGQNATIRGMEILNGEGLDVRIIEFPDNLDPDEFVRKNGKEAFEKLKDDALPLNLFKIKKMASQYKLELAIEREKYAIEACKYIASLQPVQQNQSFKLLSRISGFTVDELRAQSEKEPDGSKDEVTVNRISWQDKVSTGHSESTSSYDRAESVLIHAMTSSKEVFLYAMSNNALDYIQNDAYKTFIQKIGKFENSNSIASALNQMDEKDVNKVSFALQEELPNENLNSVVLDCLKRLNKIKLTDELSKLKEELSNNSLNSDVLNKIQKINSQLKNL